MSAERSRLQRLDAISSAAVRFGFFCIWPVAIAVALGATLFSITHSELLPAMFDNRLTHPQRIVALNYLLGSLIGVGVLYAAVLGWRYRRDWPPGFDRARRLHPLLSFLLSGPAIVALTESRIETQHTWRTWLYIALAAAAWWPTFRALSGRKRAANLRAPALSSRQRDFVGLGIAFVLWGAYAYFFTRLAITNHHLLNTRIVDLGLYDNIFFHSSHGDPLGCSFMVGGNHSTAHFDPILVILSPLYRLWPGPELLLTIQSVWCGAGIVGTYLLGRHQLGSRAWGLVWALVYALHPALHGANLYEFHSLTLLISPLIFALHFLLAGRIRMYLATLVLLLLIREDVSLLMCFVGLFGVVSGDPRLKRAGWVTIIASLAYFALAKTVFMASPDLFNEGDGTYGFAYYYNEMMPNEAKGKSFFITLLTNPAFLAALITKEAKLLYLLVIFSPLLFLPAWAGRARLILLYGFTFILLASRKPVYSPHFQYSAVILPVAVALAPLGLRRLRDARRSDGSLTGGVMGCVLVVSLLASWKFGAIVENDSFRGGFRPIKRGWDDAAAEHYDSFQQLISSIGPEASVSATDRLGSHVSSRATAHRLDQNIDTDYLLVHAHDLKGRNRVSLDRRKKEGKVELVERVGVWTLYRAVSPPEPE
ncbi:MAG: DUF2079 domain-containing protein [Polyangiales bacterium]